MSVARRAGLATPDFWLSDDAERFIIERFDRDVDGHPLGFEDMAVLAGLSAAEKYRGSYEGILRIVQTYCTDKRAALETVFFRIAASALLKDGDAHLKNFGLLYEHPGAVVSPAPAYDIVCTPVYPELDRGLALKMNKSRTFPTPNDLLRLADRFSIDREFAQRCIGQIEHAIDDAFIACREDPRFQSDPHRTLTKLWEVLRPVGGKHNPTPERA